MGIVKPTNKTVESFKGLHLYHTEFSNCSMRVRIALEEKGLDWT
ncbi:MAG: glutathione S-transferase N-terminal domain-containing protein, partial [Psychromonas sp.]